MIGIDHDAGFIRLDHTRRHRLPILSLQVDLVADLGIEPVMARSWASTSECCSVSPRSCSPR